MDRRSFENGKLDEIVSTRGAHLEHLGSGRWFLSFQHEDGTETALWFTSRDLLKPFWEIRMNIKVKGDKGDNSCEERGEH